MEKIAVYGDSIAFGFGSGNRSWFDLLPNSYQTYKLAFNGARIEDVLFEINQGNEKFQMIFLAVGINDLFGMTNFNYEQLLGQYEEIISIAKQKADKIIVQTVLPVLENPSPQQIWFQKQESLNLVVEGFNLKLEELAIKHNCLFVNAYSEFKNLDLEKLYCDEVHLNNEGQKKLLDIYINKLTMLKNLN